MIQSYKVSCFGAGFVGIPTMSVLALKNPNLKFVVYDISKERIALCQQNNSPIYEPGLEKIMVQTNHKNLQFTDNIGEALNEAAIVFLALPTPTKYFGEQKGRAYDMSYTQSAIREIVKYYNNHSMRKQVILVEKSTVPIGTAKVIEEIIAAVSIKENIHKYAVASNPQFLAEGTAVNNLLFPDRVVIGSRPEDNVTNLSNLYGFVDAKQIIKTNQYSSELSKLAANCFLAQRVSSINSIALLCEEYPSDVKEVKACIAADTRIGSKFLQSSVGFGGSCFKKDILALIYLSEMKGLTEVAKYWNAVLEMNQYRKKNFFLKVFQACNSNLKGKTIAVFGMAFKKDTNDSRESPAVEICHYLLEEGAILKVFDPETKLANFISEITIHELWKEGYVNLLSATQKAEDAVKGSQAIIILTEWDIFTTYDYKNFYEIMEKPAHIFDGRNILKEVSMTSLGFKYHCVGKMFNS